MRLGGRDPLPEQPCQRGQILFGGRIADDDLQRSSYRDLGDLASELLSQAVGAAHVAGVKDLRRAGVDAGLRLESRAKEIDPIDTVMPEIQVNELLDYLARAIAHDVEPPADAMSHADLVLGRGGQVEDCRRIEPGPDARNDRASAVVLLQPVWQQEASVGVAR